jgi:hypothetical protein
MEGPRTDTYAFGRKPCRWLKKCLKISHQILITASQRCLELFQSEQGRTLLACLNHLDVSLGHIGLNRKGVLAQPCSITQSMEVLAKNLQRASRCLVLHSTIMPNQGFA